MLLRFRFSNFKSFRDTQELSLVAAGPSEASRKVRGFEHRVLPVAAIYGANASGKSNVLKALQFMKTAVEDSHRLWKPDGPIPRSPYALDPSYQSKPSEFSADFLVGTKRFEYGFLVDDTKVVKEWLHAFPGGNRQVWFSRSGRRVNFWNMLRGPNKQIAALLRGNSLLLSAAAQNGHAFLSVASRFFSRAFEPFSERRTIPPDFGWRLATDPALQQSISSVLSLADFGIGGIEAEPAKESRTRETSFISNLARRPFKLVPFHFMHKAGSNLVAMEAKDESMGTLAFLALVCEVLNALDKGLLITVDEIDASLHAMLAAWLMQRFNDPHINTKVSQLIFATHETSLLSSGLSRDQIWFTEKDRDGASHLYPLSDFHPQPNEDLQTGYLQGRYGAIPFLNSNLFLSSMKQHNGKK
ncbi:MAG: AAA family ATPase [Bryobacteraceae bacterium]